MGHAWRAAGLCHEVRPHQRRPAPAPLLAKHEQTTLPQGRVHGPDDTLQLLGVRRSVVQEVIDSEGRRVPNARSLSAAPPAQRAQPLIDVARAKALHVPRCWLAAYPKGVRANVENWCHATPCHIVGRAKILVPVKVTRGVSQVVFHTASSFWPKAVRDMHPVRCAEGRAPGWQLPLSRNSYGGGHEKGDTRTQQQQKKHKEILEQENGARVLVFRQARIPSRGCFKAGQVKPTKETHKDIGTRHAPPQNAEA